jgi:predicted dehydrogenase
MTSSAGGLGSPRFAVPARPLPVVIVGAGDVVNEAHLPAYRACGLPVVAVFDAVRSRAEATAARWSIPRVLDGPRDVAALSGAVFDVAVPPTALDEVLSGLPEGAAVLVQKPFGLDLDHATRLREIGRRRGLTIAVNFQLRFAPAMVALRDLVRRGALGEIFDCDVRVQCRTPWERWPFLVGLPRLEIAVHSVHYLDLIRALLGEPRAAQARTLRHPETPTLAATRTSAILDFGERIRCSLSLNHHHRGGPRHEASELRLEGSRGAALVVMGVNLDYPRGRPDRLEVRLGDADWRDVPLSGSWFPDAFRGPMCNLQRFVAGEDAALESPADDAWRTMALVEALYDADRRGGSPVPRDPSPSRAAR